MKYIELLAPAKDLATARAAIDCGADAVYMGGPRLGARAAATNSLDDIREAARYAHLYGARLYMTMNTIVYDHEIDEARKIAQAAIDAGVDALIIQDPAYLRMGLVGAELHASTQMYNAATEGVAFWGNTGISRIVLERGLTKEQMAEICAATDAEIEVFIHGAICVGGSGRCYMSRSLSHRSGNRGECSQPCRQTYDLVDGTGKVVRKGLHLLSVKDMDMSAHIGELIDMGVTSMKIEGRLKDEAYVRNITAHYRRLIDRAIAERQGYARSSAGHSQIDFTPSPAKTFTRSGGDYVYGGKRAGLASFDTPKATGEMVGKVKKVGPRWFALDRSAKFAPGDGICFVAGGVLCGTNVNAVDGERIMPNKMDSITVGTTIYKNFDKLFADSLRASRTRRTLDASLRLEASLEELRLTATDCDGNTATATATGPFEAANNPEGAVGAMQTNLAKSGGSVFVVRNVEVVGCDIPFVAMGAINALRREVLDRLAEIRMEQQPAKIVTTEVGDTQYPLRHVGGDHNVVNRLSREFYASHGVERIEEGYDLAASLDGVEVMRTPYCIRREMGQCLKKGSKLREPLTLRHGDEEFRLRFDCKNCTMHVVRIEK